jgi:subtilase family protein
MNSRESSADVELSNKGGKGVRVAVLDSGINAQHSHVRRVAGGVHLRWNEDGRVELDSDYRDLLGHGTAVAGVIRAKAPEAELYAVRVFDRELRTHAAVVAAAIRWAVEHGMHAVNISLGTERDEHREILQAACDEASRSGVILVAASEGNEKEWFPASFANVIAVAGDERCAWDEHFYCPGDAVPFRAHPSPRPLPGRPQKFNLRGHSFAAAHITARVAQILAEKQPARYEETVQLLVERAIPAEQLAGRVPA